MYSNDIKSRKFNDIWKGLFRKRTKRLLTNTEKEFQKSLFCFMSLYGIMIVMGILFAVLSDITLQSCSIFLGILLLAFALMYFFYFLRARKFTFYKVYIFFALGTFALGLLFFFLQAHFVLILSGAFMMLIGLERVIETVFFFRMKNPGKVVLLVSTIFLFLLGALIMINPFVQLMYREVIGIFLILFSLLNISINLLLHREISSFIALFD